MSYLLTINNIKALNLNFSKGDAKKISFSMPETKVGLKDGLEAKTNEWSSSSLDSADFSSQCPLFAYFPEYQLNTDVS
jgi:hypothetical protein